MTQTWLEHTHAHFSFLRGRAWGHGGSAHPDADFSGCGSTTQLIYQAEQDRQVRVPRQQPVHPPSPRPHQLAGQPHEGVQERLELQPQHPTLLRSVLLLPESFSGPGGHQACGAGGMLVLLFTDRMPAINVVPVSRPCALPASAVRWRPAQMPTWRRAGHGTACVVRDNEIEPAPNYAMVFGARQEIDRTLSH